MSKIVDDVKSGLKAVHGAGDAIRGSTMEIADQALNSNSKYPETTASQAKNRAIAEKGKQDMRLADEEIGLRERERLADRGGIGSASAAPAHQPAVTTNTPASAPHAGGMTRPNDPQFR